MEAARRAAPATAGGRARWGAPPLAPGRRPSRGRRGWADRRLRLLRLCRRPEERPNRRRPCACNVRGIAATGYRSKYVSMRFENDGILRICDRACTVHSYKKYIIMRFAELFQVCLLTCEVAAYAALADFGFFVHFTLVFPIWDSLWSFYLITCAAADIAIAQAIYGHQLDHKRPLCFLPRYILNLFSRYLPARSLLLRLHERRQTRVLPARRRPLNIALQSVFVH